METTLAADANESNSFAPISLESDTASMRLSATGTFRGGMYSQNTPASPPAYDPETQRLFIGSVDRQAIDVLDIRNPYAPKKIFDIDVGPFGGEPISLGVKNDLVAVAVKDADDSSQPGKVVFFNTHGERLADPVDVKQAGRLAFTPDGEKVVVAIPGRPSDSVDPEGAVAIIDLGLGNRRGCGDEPEHGHIKPTLVTADFKDFNDMKNELIAAGVRIFGPNDPTVAQDLAPEAVAVSPDSHLAWVTLQANNALAVVALNKGKVMDILPLGSKDHSVPGNGLDASDEDSAINIQPWPIHSFYMPDGIAVTSDEDQTFLVTVNEGDPKDTPGYPYSEKVRVKDLQLDPDYFPDAATLQQDENLGRLQVTNATGDIDGDGDFDNLYLPGARSFSIWTAGGEQVFDSGDDFERITALGACPSNVEGRYPLPLAAKGLDPPILVDKRGCA